MFPVLQRVALCLLDENAKLTDIYVGIVLVIQR